MAIASLRVPAPDVVEALSTLDELALNAEQAEKVRLIVPEPEQAKLLEDNRAKADELTKEEQYLLEILKVPGIKGHLICLDIKHNFSDRFLNLNKSLQSLRKAVIAVEDNPELKQLFIMLLKIGNFLNQGSAKGNSTSFNIDMLRNLKSAKGVGTHQKSTMLDFLLNSILTKTPNVANFAIKLEGCQDAIKLDLTTVGDLIKNFQEQAEKIKDVIGEKKK